MIDWQHFSVCWPKPTENRDERDEPTQDDRDSSGLPFIPVYLSYWYTVKKIEFSSYTIQNQSGNTDYHYTGINVTKWKLYWTLVRKILTNNNNYILIYLFNFTRHILFAHFDYKCTIWLYINANNFYFAFGCACKFLKFDIVTTQMIM